LELANKRGKEEKNMGKEKRFFMFFDLDSLNYLIKMQEEKLKNENF